MVDSKTTAPLCSRGEDGWSVCSICSAPPGRACPYGHDVHDRGATKIKEKQAGIVARLDLACTGHPHAHIPWSLRLLQDASKEIQRLRTVVRVNGLRLGYSHEEIDAVLKG